jgi:hypothetical protein
MEIQEYRADVQPPIRVGCRVRHVDAHADLPEGTVVALPPASERVAVVQPHRAGRSPYLCPIGHLVALDLDAELGKAVRRLMRVDHLGRELGAVLSSVTSTGKPCLSLPVETGSIRAAG